MSDHQQQCRNLVGGLWDEIGLLQLDFMKAQGLKPYHLFLDIACGCLRGGVHFIEYLERGHYSGIDSNSMLLISGIQNELPTAALIAKSPEFLCDSNFNFGIFNNTNLWSHSLAQSLFTHLTLADIKKCLESLFSCTPQHHKLFATFFNGNNENNPEVSSYKGVFFYEVKDFVDLSRWKVSHLGKWGHPRKQEMLVFTK